MRDAALPSALPRHARIAIVGGGFGGIGTAIRLKQRGWEDFVILERASDLGGTWRDNDYPGCACDVQSHLYSFSFAPYGGWSRTFSPQGEIWAYLRECASRFGIAPHFRFGHEVTGARWNDGAARWDIETSGGRMSAAILVLANGPLSDPVIPDIPGLGSFEGVTFHSPRWRHDVELAGKSVAVIGTGASAIQFVPRIQPLVKRLHLFQRTPPWIMPRRDREIPSWRRRLYATVPGLQAMVRGGIYVTREAMGIPFRHPAVAEVVQHLAIRHLQRSVRDPVLRAKLTPSYTIGCKRILISDDFLPSLEQPNVELVTAGVAGVDARSVIDSGGVRRDADVIILATGFRATDPLLAPHVYGRGGRSLAEEWRGSPKAHVGTTVAGFPNLFILLGPNTGLGHSSVLLMLEAQIEHVLGALALLRARGAASIEPRAEAQDAFVRQTEGRLARTVWNSGGCRSWYLDRTGRNSSLWPDGTWRFRRRVARIDPTEYVTSRGANGDAMNDGSVAHA